MASDEKIQYYEETFQKMEKRLKIFSYLSCQEIYTYLLIFGKMTAKNLLEKLDFSRGTIFKALSILYEAKLVEKGEDPEILDKRQNTYYYAKKFDIEILGGPDFLDYAIKTGKLDIYKEYVRNALTISTAMIKIAERIPLERSLKKMESGELSSECSGKGQTIHYIEVNSIPDQKRLIEKIRECVSEFESQIKEQERDFKEPLKNPVAFMLYFSSLD
ncbi:MAG: hypothetical protein ACFFD4_14715 [Candidatus Odinarchaeota archaeon]